MYLRGRRGHDGATGVAKRTPAAHSRYMAAGIGAATLPQCTNPRPTPALLIFLLASIPFLWAGRGPSTAIAACVGLERRGGTTGGAGSLVAAAGWGALAVWAGLCRWADFHGWLGTSGGIG
ncbi:MAG: hypothetical protein KDD27_00050 [Saprospiraceae bacterium]|nr:hypothetical protein [Saprospiraceae bacterium]